MHWSGRWVTIPLPPPWQGGALPIELRLQFFVSAFYAGLTSASGVGARSSQGSGNTYLDARAGIEPALKDSESRVLPLDDRAVMKSLRFKNGVLPYFEAQGLHLIGAGDRDRTDDTKVGNLLLYH